MGAHCSRDYTGGVSFRIRTMQKFSIIIPVYNGGVAWWCCLEALLRLDPAPYEIIAVDDGSTDGSQNVPTTRGVRALKTPAPRSGPAVARNLGAMQAHGEILWFVDSDVVVQADALSRLDDAFRDPELAAVFGSYDDAPGASNFLSQYRNLLHHYVHQNSPTDTTSFWAGCGAIRANVFERAGGFCDSYARPSIEDIELGYRLRRMNCRVRLDKDLQVKHLKRWTFKGMLRTDIRDRAIPWAELLAQERELPRDLNLRVSHRISALLCWLGIALLALLALAPQVGWLLVPLVAALVLLNYDLYRFFLRRHGVGFMLGAMALHWLYYLYSSAAFAFVLARCTTRRFAPLFAWLPNKFPSPSYKPLERDKGRDATV
jgi:glycosyltransferase involved in cell wall biosynthesis